MTSPEKPKKTSAQVLEALDDLSGAFDDLNTRLETRLAVLETGALEMLKLLHDLTNTLKRIEDDGSETKYQVQDCEKTLKNISEEIPGLVEVIDDHHRHELNDMRKGLRLARAGMTEVHGILVQ